MTARMKLGIFDSGLGGVMIARSLRAHFPDIDIVYYGDTLRVPYGNRSHDAIYGFCKKAMDIMLGELDCRMVIVACNTASASALRKLQQEYLPAHYPDRRILGVVVPTIEHAIDKGYKRLGLIGTNYTVGSNVYQEELQKIDPSITIEQVNTPLLVPLIENDGEAWIDDVLDHYMKPLIAKGIDALILSCTHYVCLKDRIRERYGVDVISQDEIIPMKLDEYFGRHPEIFKDIGQSEMDAFYASDLTPAYVEKVRDHYGDPSVLLSYLQTQKVAA